MRGNLKAINRVLERLACAKLNQYEFNVCLAVLRKTLGWCKATDWISLSQLSKMTGINEKTIPRTKKALIDRRILHISGKQIGFNMQFDEWKAPAGQLASGQTTSGEITNTSWPDDLLPARQLDTNNNYKETITNRAYELKNKYPIAEYKKKYGKTPSAHMLSMWKRMIEEDVPIEV